MTIITRHKVAFENVGKMLHELQRDRNNLYLLLELQALLLRKIKTAERNIRRLRREIKETKAAFIIERPSKEKALKAKKQAVLKNEKIQEYKHLIYLWKCFGDGIAFIYLDKYALKHTFFNVDNDSPKETPGFITGKAGFKAEWRFVQKTTAEGWPVLLCDVTNVIRHGDVCALFGPDPLLVEIKSSKNRSRRIERQIESIERLSKFYADDGAEEFRGIQNIRRVAYINEEINYTSVLNDCITRSYIEGMATVSPEPGLHYACLWSGFNYDKMHEICNNTSIIISLNERKSNNDWIFFYPFTLSIKPEHLFNFIDGSLYLIVVIDRKKVKANFYEKGFHLTFLSDKDYLLQICRNRDNLQDGVYRVSHHMFLRIAYEFQSIDWFVNERILGIQRIENTLIDERKGPLYEVPESWFGLTDDLDDWP
jgi:Holliday junction resolvase